MYEDEKALADSSDAPFHHTAQGSLGIKKRQEFPGIVEEDQSKVAADSEWQIVSPKDRGEVLV